MSLIQFSKYTGCGNDFIMIDHRIPFLDTHNADLIKKLCHRNKGIGADGLILLEKDQCHDFAMRIFNSNGKEAEMCGNGLRCLGAFLIELGFPKKMYQIKTQERSLIVDFFQDQIKTSMGLPILNGDLSLQIDQTKLNCYALNTGVPHAVVFVDSIEETPVDLLGAKIRHHARFGPHGTNANFAEKISSSELSIRTFERGVEGETLACGTGAAASAVAACVKWNLKGPIRVKLRSKDTLTIDFMLDDQGNFSNVTQTGPAVKLFHGAFDIRGYL